MADQPRYSVGDVVQLNSGGPLLTIYATDLTASTHVIYYNSNTGLFEKFHTDSRCLRAGIGRPEIPSNADKMRTTSVAKSSMSS